MRQQMPSVALMILWSLLTTASAVTIKTRNIIKLGQGGARGCVSEIIMTKEAPSKHVKYRYNGNQGCAQNRPRLKYHPSSAHLKLLGRAHRIPVRVRQCPAHHRPRLLVTEPGGQVCVRCGFCHKPQVSRGDYWICSATMGEKTKNGENYRPLTHNTRV